MITAPPDPTTIDTRLTAVRAKANQRIQRRSHVGRIGIGAALAGTFTLAGAGIATASFPVTIDMQGVVKTKYVDEFVQCSEDAGVETVILTGSTAANVLEGWTDLDIATYTAVESRMDSRDQGRLGRALSACQAEIAERVGEPIS
ncbi:hypothetical protein AB0N73_10650 [Microbacterium sp. NPDC089189]|uniref:hypothetical protein n=1 Tax=Microbacterium sp. NPDC089189 TaxID=3154972 RepID=UPI0034180A87